MNRLFRATILHTGAIYEEVSKLPVEHTASFIPNTNPDIAPPFVSSKLWRYIEGGAMLGEGGIIGVGVYVMTLSIGWFDEDQRHLGHDAV